MQLFIWSPIIGCVLNIITLVICYGLAYKTYDNHEWMLLSPSVIGSSGPEGSIFTVGFTIAGLFYLKTSIMRHLLLRQTLYFLERENLMLLKKVHGLKILNGVSTVFGCAGSLLLCLVGLRKYADPLQDLFIIVPYGLFVVAMWANTRLCYNMRRRKTFFYFFVLSLCGSFAFTIAFTLRWFEDRSLQSIAAAAEYTLIITFVRFISLYFNDFRNSNFMSLDRLDTNINSSPLSRHKEANNFNVSDA